MAKPSLDWSRVQAFLAVAETGSLSGAARALGLSQPTVGRHLRRLEAQLGQRLFDRRPRGMALTEAGEALMPPALEMRAAANGLELAAAGRDSALDGTVRLTASVFVAHHLLPPILAELTREAPQIAIELVASDSSDNLLFREADIAIRMYRPDQLDMVARHLGDIEMGLYGAMSYVRRHGLPRSFDALREHRLVGYDRDDAILRGFRGSGWEVSRHDFAVRCDQNAVYWELVRAGCGLGFCQCGVAERDPEMRRVLPRLPVPSLPVWLTCHESLRRVPRIAHVWRHLASGLAAVVS